MTRASLYLIIIEDLDDDGFDTGVLFGKEHATTPEEAMTNLARKALDSRVEGYFDDESMVKMAEALYTGMASDEESQLVIYPVLRADAGGVMKYTVDDLNFNER